MTLFLALVVSLSGILGAAISGRSSCDNFHCTPRYCSFTRPHRVGLPRKAPTRLGAKGCRWASMVRYPWIVVDQFDYPTKAAKIAVIRNPQLGYDSMVHFTPGQNYAVVNRTTSDIIKRGTPTVWNNGATDTQAQAARPGGLISPMSRSRGRTRSWILIKDCVPSSSRSTISCTETSSSMPSGCIFTSAPVSKKRQQRPEPIGLMLRAICAPDKTLKPALGRLDARSPRAMFRRSRTSTADGSTLATTTSTQVGRPALSLPCSERTTKTRMHSVTTVE